MATEPHFRTSSPSDLWHALFMLMSGRRDLLSSSCCRLLLLLIGICVSVALTIVSLSSKTSKTVLLQWNENQLNKREMYYSFLAEAKLFTRICASFILPFLLYLLIFFLFFFLLVLIFITILFFSHHSFFLFSVSFSSFLLPVLFFHLGCLRFPFFDCSIPPFRVPLFVYLPLLHLRLFIR